MYQRKNRYARAPRNTAWQDALGVAALLAMIYLFALIGHGFGF